MSGTWILVPCLAVLTTAGVGAGEKAYTLTFAKGDLGKVPAGWKAYHTGKGGGGVWKVGVDDTAPSKTGLVLFQTGTSPGPVFNLCVSDAKSFQNVEVSVMFKANKGEKDQGGGIVWRFADADNYYLARFNPLEDNYRLYKVVGGKRMQLAGKEGITVPAGEWHKLTIRMFGDRIECSLDGKKILEANDNTLPKAGKMGLWTKADAQTSFDQFTLAEIRQQRGQP